MEMFLPGIRADFALLERGLASREQTLNCPILSLCARDDHEVRFDDVEAWRERTTAEFRMSELTGGHFYLQAERATILRHVARSVQSWV